MTCLMVVLLCADPEPRFTVESRAVPVFVVENRAVVQPLAPPEPPPAQYREVYQYDRSGRLIRYLVPIRNQGAAPVFQQYCHT